MDASSRDYELIELLLAGHYFPLNFRNKVTEEEPKITTRLYWLKLNEDPHDHKSLLTTSEMMKANFIMNISNEKELDRVRKQACSQEYVPVVIEIIDKRRVRNSIGGLISTKGHIDDAMFGVELSNQVYPSNESFKIISRKYSAKYNRQSSTSSPRYLYHVSYSKLNIIKMELSKLDFKTKRRYMKTVIGPQRNNFHCSSKLWPPYKNPGIFMQCTDVKDGCHYYEFTFTEEYVKNRIDFLNFMENCTSERRTSDLEFWTMLHPYNVDILRHFHNAYMDQKHYKWILYMSRMFFTLSENLHPEFNPEDKGTKMRFTTEGNRMFYGVLFRLAMLLAQCGEKRTAFEYLKLILSLLPYSSDMLGIFFIVDILAFEVGEIKWLLSYINSLPQPLQKGLLNLNYTKALSLYYIGSPEADEMLYESVLNFPDFFLLLFAESKNKLTHFSHPLFNDFISSRSTLQHDSFDSIMATNYCTFAGRYWLTPEIMKWTCEISLKVLERKDIAKKWMVFGGDNRRSPCVPEIVISTFNYLMSNDKKNILKLFKGYVAL